MAREGVSFYDGADSPSGRADTTIPEAPRASEGGPIDVCEGLHSGRSFGMPDSPANTVDSPSRGSGSPISGPLDD